MPPESRVQIMRGGLCRNKDESKKSAAFYCCKLLYELGELTDDLRPAQTEFLYSNFNKMADEQNIMDPEGNMRARLRPNDGNNESFTKIYTRNSQNIFEVDFKREQDSYTVHKYRLVFQNFDAFRNVQGQFIPSSQLILITNDNCLDGYSVKLDTKFEEFKQLKCVLTYIGIEYVKKKDYKKILDISKFLFLSGLSSTPLMFSEKLCNERLFNYKGERYYHSASEKEFILMAKELDNKIDWDFIKEMKSFIKKCLKPIFRQLNFEDYDKRNCDFHKFVESANTVELIKERKEMDEEEGIIFQSLFVQCYINPIEIHSIKDVDLSSLDSITSPLNLRKEELASRFGIKISEESFVIKGQIYHRCPRFNSKILLSETVKKARWFFAEELVISPISKCLFETLILAKFLFKSLSSTLKAKFDLENFISQKIPKFCNDIQIAKVNQCCFSSSESLFKLANTPCSSQNIPLERLDLSRFPKFDFPESYWIKNIEYDGSFEDILNDTISRVSIQLFERAITHRDSNSILNYERLEFFGDSILKLLSTIEVYHAFPDKSEKILTNHRTSIINNEFLKNQCYKKGLCHFLIFRENVTNFPGFKIQNLHALNPTQEIPNKVLADLVESLIAAIYLSNNNSLYAAQIFLLSLNILKTKTLKCKDDGIRNEKNYRKYFLGQKYISKPPVITRVFEAEKFIGYEFNNPFIFLQALMHISFRPFLNNFLFKLENAELKFTFDDQLKDENKNIRQVNYEINGLKQEIDAINKINCQSTLANSINPCQISYDRLEFLGDAVIDVIISNYLYHKFPEQQPKDLNILRACIVSNSVLALFALSLNLEKFALIGNAKIETEFIEHSLNLDHYLSDPKEFFKSNSNAKKILGDLFEALIGAIYVDSNHDIEFVQKFLFSKLGPLINKFLDKSFMKYSPMNRIITLCNEYEIGQPKIISMLGGKGETIYKLYLDQKEERSIECKSYSEAEESFFNYIENKVKTYEKIPEIKEPIESEAMDEDERFMDDFWLFKSESKNL